MKNGVALLLVSMTAIYGQQTDETAKCDSGKLPINSCEWATKNERERMGKNRKEKTPLHSPIEVYLGGPSYTVEVDGSAICLQPTGSHLYFASQANPFPIETPSWKIYDIEPAYQWGFDVGASVNFHSVNSNLKGKWVHLHTNDSDAVSVPASDMLGPFFEIGPDASPYKTATGRSTFHFDEAMLDYGIFIHMGDRLETNLFAGVAFARIKQNLISFHSNSSGSVSLNIESPSTFFGWGPQLGLDFSYRIVDCLTLRGNGVFDLLTGKLQNHTEYTATSPTLNGLGLPNPNGQSISTQSRMQVVPGLEGKLGLAYSVTFSGDYLIDLEVGYESKVFLNALQSTDMGSEVDDVLIVAETSGVYARTFQRTLSNFALAGPYITASFGF